MLWYLKRILFLNCFCMLRNRIILSSITTFGVGPGALVGTPGEQSASRRSRESAALPPTSTPQNTVMPPLLNIDSSTTLLITIQPSLKQ